MRPEPELRGARRDGLMSWFSAVEPTEDTTTIVLIPGLAVARYLLPAARCLATCSAGPTVLVSPPGFAGSPMICDATVPSHTKALLDWIQRSIPGRVLCVGHSTGCLLAAGVAAGLGPRCVMLAAVSPVFDPGRSSWPQLGYRFLADGRFESPVMFAVQAGEWARGGRGVMPFLRSCRSADLAAMIDRAAAPTLIVRSEKDSLSRYEWACELASRPAPDQRVMVTAPEPGHAFVYRRPAQLAQALRTGSAALGVPSLWKSDEST
jgi:pimeloyl-ACP methyl ester carboxylesterase